MKHIIKRIFLGIILICSGSLFAQTTQINPITQIRWSNTTSAGTPTTSCSSANYGMPYTDITNNNQYVCSTGGWFQVNGMSGGENIVSFSSTPVLSESTAINIITLTGDVSSSTVSSGQAGQSLTVSVCQDSLGNHAWVWPTNMRGTMSIGLLPQTCSVQSFIYSANQGAWLATGFGVQNE